MTRRGFTLIELLIGIVLTGLVGMALYQAIVGTQRITRSQVQRIDVQQTTRAAAYYMSGALRELDALDGDILFADATTMRFRANRWAGVLCAPPAVAAGNVFFVVDNALLYGLRRPDAALDSIFLFRDGDVNTRGDDQWLIGGLQTVTPGGVCLNGAAGTTLHLQIAAGSGGNAAALGGGVTNGSPIRGYQLEETSLYLSGGANWMGRRTMGKGGGWTAVEPLVGPLTNDGLAYAYLDSNGVVTGTLADVAAVGISIRGRSAEQARIAPGTVGYVRDSIITRVALRNNRRF